MLYSIREYSRERLVSAGSEPIFAAHARHYADVVASAAPLVLARDDHRWRGALSPELDNIRAAIDWSLLRGYDTRTGRRLLAAMEWSELLTTPQEAIGWFDAAANAPAEEGTEPLDRARILRHLVRLEWLVGRPLSHRERTASDALSAARASGDVNEVAQGLANLAAVNRDAGHFDEAESLFAQAYRNREQLSAIALNAVLRNWAVTNLQRGDVDTARRRFAEVAQRERPGSEAHASALLNLGELEFAVGNVESAREFAGKAREMLAKLDTAPLGLAICNLAAYAMAVDDLDQARELLREALRLLKRSGARWMTAAIEHHAVLAGLSGDRERAAVLLGFTEARYSGLRQRETTERQGYQRLESLLREAFDEDALQQRLSAGARLTEEEALEHAATISSTERSKD